MTKVESQPIVAKFLNNLLHDLKNFEEIKRSSTLPDGEELEALILHFNQDLDKVAKYFFNLIYGFVDKSKLDYSSLQKEFFNFIVNLLLIMLRLCEENFSMRTTEMGVVFHAIEEKVSRNAKSRFLVLKLLSFNEYGHDRFIEIFLDYPVKPNARVLRLREALMRFLEQNFLNARIVKLSRTSILDTKVPSRLMFLYELSSGIKVAMSLSSGRIGTETSLAVNLLAYQELEDREEVLLRADIFLGEEVLVGRPIYISQAWEL